ncbi:hypothetical protein [Bosea sp. (in: a-proteobacteria)]|uniref:hypothetical protein n=1 Tax=Bosea sp. (in: a-proteobacteria) TaxID=1871050 RepID=UPI004033A766
MTRLIRGCLAVLCLIGCGGEAPARDLVGKFGYLGEWDVSATLSEERAGRSGAASLSGPLLMKHNAVCGPGETPEKSGQIRLTLRGERYSAEMTLAGASCRFSGTLSPERHSFVACGGEQSIPLRLWFRDAGSRAP